MINHYVNFKNIPSCCRDCPKLGEEASDYGGYVPSIYYCELNIILPVVKQTCKRKRLKVGAVTRLGREGVNYD